MQFQSHSPSTVVQRAPIVQGLLPAAAPVAPARTDKRVSHPAVPVTSASIVFRPSAVEVPQSLSATNSAFIGAPNNVVLTSSNGATIDMGDIMQAILLDIKSEDKIMSTHGASETYKKRCLEETEVNS